jgi:redox-sensing transcriptional repressor
MSIRNAIVRDIDDMEAYLNEEKIDIAVICTPQNVCQQIADRVVSCGIKAIWNFAPKDLKMPEDVHVENVHLNESLFSLTYYYNNLNKER